MARYVVTGAFGYSGKYITARLLDAGHVVSTLTNSPERENPFGGRVTASPLCFDDPTRLAEALRGADALLNTYWVRFNHRNFTHAMAVENTLTLFAAAREAGVRRVVHISIANPSEQSDLEYYRGKARLERGLIESGLSYCILRPTVLFGKEDILVNNIAWTLRHLPVFGVFGDGQYRLQPIYVDDLAALAVEHAGGTENEIIDAIGPETFTFRELVQTIGRLIGKRRWIVSVPPGPGYLATWVLGKMMGDVFLTREEIKGLMRGLLAVPAAEKGTGPICAKHPQGRSGKLDLSPFPPPAGRTRLSDWAKEHAGSLGRKYASELGRRKDRRRAYEKM